MCWILNAPFTRRRMSWSKATKPFRRILCSFTRHWAAAGKTRPMPPSQWPATDDERMSSETSQFLVRHGLLIVFAAMFLEQLGLPIPAFPWLLAGGALAAVGQFSLAAGLALTVAACLI